MWKGWVWNRALEENKIKGSQVRSGGEGFRVKVGGERDKKDPAGHCKETTVMNVPNSGERKSKKTHTNLICFVLSAKLKGGKVGQDRTSGESRGQKW